MRKHQVLALVDSLRVGLGELACGLACEDTHGELGHRVHGLGEALNKSLNFLWEFTTVEEFSLEFFELMLRWELSSEEEPEGCLGKRLRATWGLVSLSSNLEEILPSVGDTINVMKLGCFIEETGHASHSSNDLTDGHISELGVTVFLLEQVENLLFLVNGMFHLLLKCDREVSLVALYQHILSANVV